MALQRLAVNTVAESWVGPSLTTSARSLAPVLLSPATTPAARKPAGVVTLISFFLGGLAGTAAVTSCPDRRHSSSAASALSPGTRIQSVSKVESVKTLISAAASGASSSASTPVSAKSSGPSTSKAVNGRWWTDLAGTLRAAQTTEVSVAVAVTEKIEEDSAQAGTSVPGPSLTTARVSG